MLSSVNEQDGWNVEDSNQKEHKNKKKTIVKVEFCLVLAKLVWGKRNRERALKKVMQKDFTILSTFAELTRGLLKSSPMTAATTKSPL